MNHSRWEIFVDGASRGNPGPSGAGIYARNNNHIIKQGYYLGTLTNNQAEYLALCLALFLIRSYTKKHDLTLDHIAIHSDSQLLVQQMLGVYKVKNYKLQILKNSIERFLEGTKSSFTHIFRDQNTIADALANVGIDSHKKIPQGFFNLLLSEGITLEL